MGKIPRCPAKIAHREAILRAPISCNNGCPANHGSGKHGGGDTSLLFLVVVGLTPFPRGGVGMKEECCLPMVTELLVVPLT